MWKLAAAFGLGVIVTVVTVAVVPTREPPRPAGAATAAAPRDSDELDDHRALETRLDSLEREITSDAGSGPAPEAPEGQRR
jgi:hypothetical protein